MHRLALVLGITLLVGAPGRLPAFAQSGESFNFTSDGTACADISGLLGDGPTQLSLKTTLKVASGDGVAVVIRPSVVAGLVTDTTIPERFGSGATPAAAQAAVTFAVAITPLNGQAAPMIMPAGAVTYDDRFLKISRTLFTLLSVCTDATPCRFFVRETSLAAHSFDFVATGLSTGNYGVTVSWTPVTTAPAPRSALACVGPIVITAEPSKAFQQGTSISF